VSWGEDRHGVLACLDGVVIVSGASAMNGIGRAVALRAAELGADVVLSDLPPERCIATPDEQAAGWCGLESVADEVRSRGRRCLVVPCDMVDRHQIEDLVDRATGFGTVTGLVNAARAVIAGDRSPVLEITDADWDLTMAVNVRGPMTCSTEVAKVLIAAGVPGSIVNISSFRGSHPLPGKGAYCSSKAALEMLTRVMALELGPHGIRVNAVAPGTVATNRVNLVGQHAAVASGQDLDDYRSGWLADRAEEAPLGRVAEPTEIASVVAFLLSSASGYITGECLQVSGGRSAR
jgi:3-oxoacyl-[acyl-carrier protein] reductase